MSDIVIRGMVKPKNCDFCQFGVSVGFGKVLCPFDAFTKDKNNPDCPLVEVKRVESIDDVMEGICYVEVSNGRNTY